MNILHLTHTDINSDSRILKEMGCIAMSNPDYNVRGIGVVSEEEIHKTDQQKNIDIYSIKLRSRRLTFFPDAVRHTFTLVELTVKMVFKALRLRPQVIHCNDTLVLPLGVLVKFFTGAKLIYDAHELESDRNGLSRMLGKMTLYAEKSLWKYIDALIVVSPSIDQWYQETIGKKRSEVILNSPILEKNIGKEDKDYLRNKFGIPNDSRIFLYIGILGKGRGIELVTEAFGKEDIKASLVFLGYGESSEALKEISAQSKNIFVHDAVPHEQVVTIAQSADIGLCLIENVSLSDYYCLPNKLFEYTFANIPVLASDFPEIANVVNKYGLGLLCDLDTQSIYSAIKKYEQMEELPMIDSNKLFELSWKAQEAKLIRLYNTVLQGEK